MNTRSKLIEQVKFVNCGNTAFAKGTAESALIVASANSKELSSSDNSASGFVKFADLSQGNNWVDLCTAKAYIKTNDSSAVAVLGDFAKDPVANS